MTRTAIPRWRSGVGASLVCLLGGLLTGYVTLLAVAVIPLVYVGVSALSGVPTPITETLRIERSLSGVPVPGEHVTVELQLENVGDAPLPDLRVIDGVPDALRVVDGSPRASASIAPGETTTFSYDVIAVRGDHEFDQVRLETRNATATTAEATAVEPAGATTLSSRVELEDVPLPEQTMNYIGDLPTRSGGEGVEFFSTREYRRGDPLTRIHWRHLAKTGDLTTINYRENKAARVVLLVDARPSVRLTPKAGYPSAVEYSTYAAMRLLNTLVEDGHLVGVSTVGTGTTVTPASPPVEWIEPGGGPELKARVTSLFDAILDEEASGEGQYTEREHEVLRTYSPAYRRRSQSSGMEQAPTATDGGLSVAGQLRKHLPSDAQLILFSPVIDDYFESITSTLQAHGHEVTVLSPDITAPADTAGGALEAVSRATHLDALRDTGAHVIDWNPDTPLPLALAKTSIGGSTDGN